ncbi:MAG: hypothetical protein ACMXYM_01700 [Candidatus Woesearchaeota archaeon]
MTASGTYESRGDTHDLNLDSLYEDLNYMREVRANWVFGASVSTGAGVLGAFGFSPLEGWLEAVMITAALGSAVASGFGLKYAQSEIASAIRTINQIEQDTAYTRAYVDEP